jgi:hypothetical protein
MAEIIFIYCEGGSIPKDGRKHAGVSGTRVVRRLEARGKFSQSCARLAYQSEEPLTKQIYMLLLKTIPLSQFNISPLLTF